MESVRALFASEEGEEWLPFAISAIAKDLNLTPQRDAVHLLLFGQHAEGKPHLEAFTADPHGIRYRTETEEEEAFNDWLWRRYLRANARF